MLPRIEPISGFARSPRAAADRRAIERLLAALYAALLLVAIWQLERGDLPGDVTPVPTVGQAVARAQALMLGFTESLRHPPREVAPLSRQQAMPEGWPLWTVAADEHAARHTEAAVAPGSSEPDVHDSTAPASQR